MKNLYGTLPGLIYGWPKNVLHYAGIAETVVDINASLPPTIAIVDGILCMEGDGPILGTPKAMGLLAIGLNPTAVDATLARITGFDPHKVPYLVLAEGRLGPIAEWAIVATRRTLARTGQSVFLRRRAALAENADGQQRLRRPRSRHTPCAVRRPLCGSAIARIGLVLRLTALRHTAHRVCLLLIARRRHGIMLCFPWRRTSCNLLRENPLHNSASEKGDHAYSLPVL